MKKYKFFIYLFICLLVITIDSCKGVKEIEDDYHWHGKVPSPVESKRFLKNLS